MRWEGRSKRPGLSCPRSHKAPSCQVLYQSRVHPESISSALDDAVLAALRCAIEEVLATACAVDADAERFPPEWLFHRRWEKGRSRPHTHDGLPIEFITAGGRTSAVILALQKRVSARAGMGKSAPVSANTTKALRGGIKRKVAKPDAEAGVQHDVLTTSSLGAVAAVHGRRSVGQKSGAGRRPKVEGQESPPAPVAAETLGKRRR